MEYSQVMEAAKLEATIRELTASADFISQENARYKTESENNKVGFWEMFRSIATNRLFVVFTLGPSILPRMFVD